MERYQLICPNCMCPGRMVSVTSRRKPPSATKDQKLPDKHLSCFIRENLSNTLLNSFKSKNTSSGSCLYCLAEEVEACSPQRLDVAINSQVWLSEPCRIVPAGDRTCVIHFVSYYGETLLPG